MMLAILFAGAACAARPQLATGPAAGAPEGITVLGTGEAMGQPDLARAELGVQSRATTVTEASEQANARMRAIIDALIKLGVARADIRTQSISLHEERREVPGPVPGRPGEVTAGGTLEYVAQNTLEVTVRNLAQLGQLLGAATAAGANQILGVRLEVADPTALRRQAREKAVADARDQAAHLARLAGVRLQEVVAIRTVALSGPHPVPLQMADRMEAASAVPVEPGQLTVRQQVEIRFALSGG
jgi:hypothetical protein